MNVRERPPLRTSTQVTTPNGRRYRWGQDEPDPANVPGGQRWSDTMPGGYESYSATLPRKPGVDYNDLERLATVQVVGAGGKMASETRLESAPRTSGDQMAVTPAAVGWQAHLDDDKSARMIYRDIDLSRWGPLSAERRIGLPLSNWSPSDAQVVPDETTGAPRLFCEVATAAWGAADRPSVEGWYSSGGIALDSIYYGYDKNGSITLPDPNWKFEVYLSTDDLLVTVDTAGIAEAASGSGTLTTATSTRRYAAVQLAYLASGGTANRLFGLYWKNLAVYGKHGLTKRGTEPNAGFYASDIATHAVQTWAPQLRITADSVQQSTFVIPHLVFYEPTTAGEIIKQASRFLLPDWAVWQDRTFWFTARGAQARYWRARIGPAELEETGVQVDRLWESVIVRFQDVDGSTKTVGPPVSGADTEDATLESTDPDNPAVQLGITRRDMLQIGTSTPAGAIAVGSRFLQEARQLDRSGKAKAVGHIEDNKGVLHPYWAPRAGDYISFVDAADSSYRRIVRTDKDEQTKTVTFDLDAPPEGLDALLERMGAVIVSLGLS